ncbi:MAG TPA: response regulator transcription factor [Candidatus Limnocylindrales bacterium]|nr:response regulator transcription factor [Candidatus Limnocylindrales bacterium]
MRAIRVVVAEDHPLVRDAVRRVLDQDGIEVVGEAATVDEARERAIDARPDVLLLDLDLQGVSALPLIGELSARLPQTTIVVLTGQVADRLVGAAVQAGARGYLTKDLRADELRRAVLSAAEGELAMSRRHSRIAVDYLAGVIADPAGDFGLSAREIEILRLVAEGRPDRDIAERLVLSPRTVESHVGQILRKLGVRNRTEAAARYRDLSGLPAEEAGR